MLAPGGWHEGCASGWRKECIGRRFSAARARSWGVFQAIPRNFVPPLLYSPSWAVSLAPRIMVEFHVVSCFAQATGPSIMATKEIFNGKMECEGPSCDATWEASLGGLSALHQVLFVSARLEKPHYKTHPEAEKSPFEALQADFPLTFHITAVGIDDSGKEHTLLSNATHTRTVNCPAHAMQCDPFVVCVRRAGAG